MKLTRKSKETSRSNISKAVESRLDQEILVGGNDSFGSVASSVTAPPSQTASFYKKVLNSHAYGEYDHGDDSNNGGCLSSQDLEGYWNESSSKNDTSSLASSQCTEETKSKKKKKKKKKKYKKKLKVFGAPIKEGQDEEGSTKDDIVSDRPRRRRLSLFGNAGNSGQSEKGEVAERGNVRTEPTDDDASLGSLFSAKDVVSTPAEENPPSRVLKDEQVAQNFTSAEMDLGYEDAAPSLANHLENFATRDGKTKRRGSITSLFSRKSKDDHVNLRSKRRGSFGGVFSKKDNIPSRSKSCETDMWYEYSVAMMTTSQQQKIGKPKRRSSIGKMFSKNEDVASREPSTERDLGYENAAPTSKVEQQNKKEKTKRRSSLGLFSKSVDSDDRSLDGNHAIGLDIDKNTSGGQRSGMDDSWAAATLDIGSTNNRKMRTGSLRRRSSLTGASFGIGKKQVPKYEMHWIVNKERVARGMEPFTKNGMLDKLAKTMARELAFGLPPSPSEFYGNVGKGKNLEAIHSTIMNDHSSISRKNILSTNFTQFGMALSQAIDGEYFMVQLFTKF